MTEDKDRRSDQGQGEKNFREPRDLVDFHLRWHEFRPFATELAASTELTAEQKATVDWLIRLSDRVRQNDL